MALASLSPQKVKAYTTPTTTMFPRVAMMAIQSRTASLVERGDSSGWLWPLEVAWTLAGELNREYSVLKSSLGESMNTPPIMGNCAAIKERSMVSLLAWLPLLPALQFSLLLLLLSPLSLLRVQPPAQLSGRGRNSEQVPRALATLTSATSAPRRRFFSQRPPWLQAQTPLRTRF